MDEVGHLHAIVQSGPDTDRLDAGKYAAWVATSGLSPPTLNHVGPLTDYLKMRTAVEACPLDIAAQLRALLFAREGDVRAHPPPSVSISGAYRCVEAILAETATGEHISQVLALLSDRCK